MFARLAVGRAPTTVTVDLPGMTDDNSEAVEKPDYASMLAAMSKLVTTWYDNHPAYAIPANLQLESSLVYDEKYMLLKFGCDVVYLTNKLGVDFNAVENNKKSIYISRFQPVSSFSGITVHMMTRGILM